MITLYSSVRKRSKDQNFKKIKIHTVSLFSNPSWQKVDFKIRSISLIKADSKHFVDHSFELPVFIKALGWSKLGPYGMDHTDLQWKTPFVMNLSLCLGNGNKLYSKVNFHNYGHVNGHEFFGFLDSVRIFFDWYSIWMFDCKLIMHV